MICLIRGSVTLRQKQLTLTFLIYGLIMKWGLFLVKGLCGIRRVAFIESGQACYHADSQSVKRPTILFRSLPSRFDITRFSKRLSSTIGNFVSSWAISNIPDESWKCVRLYLAKISVFTLVFWSSRIKRNSENFPCHLCPKWNSNIKLGYLRTKMPIMWNKLCSNKFNIFSWIQNDVPGDLHITVETITMGFALNCSCLIYTSE